MNEDWYCILVFLKPIISFFFYLFCSPPVRRASANVVSIIAKYAVPTGEWPDLLPFLFQCSQSVQEDHREVSNFLFYNQIWWYVWFIMIEEMFRLEIRFMHLRGRKNLFRWTYLAVLQSWYKIFMVLLSFAVLIHVHLLEHYVGTFVHFWGRQCCNLYESFPIFPIYLMKLPRTTLGDNSASLLNHFLNKDEYLFPTYMIITIGIYFHGL